MSVELPRVAVLLAAYNGTSWLDDQLHSILKQVNVHISVFISVDPSSDGTEALCESYTQQYKNVILLPPVGKFGGASRNFFRLIRDVDFSTFDYVALSDQDDIWHLDKLDRATTKLQSADLDAYSSNVTAFWPSGRRVLLDKAQPQVRWDHLFEAAGPGCTYVLKRRLAEAFKASLIEQWQYAQNVSLHDWYCYAFARSHGFRWFIDPISSMDYRQHENNQVGANTGVLAFLTRLKTITNGWWPDQVLLIAQLIDSHYLSTTGKAHSRHLLFLKLIFVSRHCRRRQRDKFLFVIACLAAAISLPNKSFTH
ncbi:Lipopolysaccharide biosynthesis protein [Pseudomonas syringae pv. actinidiae]|uniref:Lipopolysaccharide biosynthesis protein n=1 Tax=Pseudomonas syringae pv. actinidiae TaxID=103796 RepID=A0A7Z6Y189_PSESF|nr:glycosyltransferase [Pseudomonas syringae]RMR54152.1 Lipopolysaccharide biosynthesis protein [Pseudomonas syringae pv. actinidiae]